MRVVAALGGNALLERGERPDAQLQEDHVKRAVQALVPIAHRHELVVTHGNGPQVGVIAEESSRDRSLTRPYPFDVLGAETQGMIGYWLLQALENALPGRTIASLVCQTVVANDDPAFENPTKYVGPVYSYAAARSLMADTNWTMRRDGELWRRVVASPEPLELVELGSIRTLLEHGAVVVCAGGGGIPVARDPDGRLHGVEAVIDKDLAASLLAHQLGADALLLLTDVPAVQLGFGTPEARDIGTTTVQSLRGESFPAGSVGPKVEAVCRFVDNGGHIAAIGALDDADAMLEGCAGTRVVP
jgi:carbamate kinase